MIGGQYRIEVSLRNGVMAIHHLVDELPDTGKREAFIKKCSDRDLIGGI